MLAHLLPALPADCQPCLLDSADGSGPSFLGLWPRTVVWASGGRCVREEGGAAVDVPAPDPFAFLQAELDRHGGRAMGWLGYDLGRWVEPYPARLAADLPLPDLWFALFDQVAVLERGALRTADAALRRLWQRSTPGPVAAPPATRFTSAFTRAEYHAAVRTVLQHVRDGNLFQANLSQPFSGPLPLPPRQLFARGAHITPAPFAAYLEPDPEHAVLSFSPEEFLRIDGGVVRTQPIKGTRPRHDAPDLDQRSADELRHSAKDLAELTMIVDLLRNDLGKVARFGSVAVGPFPELATFAQVHHLYATVTAQQRPDVSVVDVVRAAFPGGSITGAPKPRAMQVIEELERVRRGVYTGAIGWLDASGAAHLNVAIRTLLVAGGQARFSVGGGIVAASTPAGEFDETLIKARGLAATLGAQLVDASGAPLSA